MSNGHHGTSLTDSDLWLKNEDETPGGDEDLGLDSEGDFGLEYAVVSS